MAQVTSPLLSCFNFSPDTTTVTDTNTMIGANIEEGDGPVERHVLETVGSYGYQINRIVDVLTVLVDQAEELGMLAKLMPEDERSIQDFVVMAARASAASEKFLSQTTQQAAERLIRGMRALGKSDSISDRLLCNRLKAQLREEILDEEEAEKKTA